MSVVTCTIPLTRCQRQHDIGCDKNNTSRVVAILGSTGFGSGINVFPYLHKTLEDIALNYTSHEIRMAIRRTKWPNIKGCK